MYMDVYNKAAFIDCYLNIAFFTSEELHMLLSLVETILNSRPLCGICKYSRDNLIYRSPSIEKGEA